MPRVEFAPVLAGGGASSTVEVEGATVKDVLRESCRRKPHLRDYLLDEEGRVRRHFAVFVDGNIVTDRRHLSDKVAPDSTVVVMQALARRG